MNTQLAHRGSLNQRLGISWGLDPNKIIGFAATFISTKGGTQVPMSKVIEFLMVCDQHRLNPATKEVAAFFSSDKGLTTFVMIDGWVKLGNQHPECDGWEFEEQADKDGKVVAVRCKVYRKDRTRPVTTPWLHMTDWRVSSSPQWGSKPSWMLSMKALKHGLRLAFGFAGIYDDEEVREIHEVKQADITAIKDSPGVVDDLGKESKASTIAASIKRDDATANTPAEPAAGEEPSANAPADAPADEAGDMTPPGEAPASEAPKGGKKGKAGAGSREPTYGFKLGAALDEAGFGGKLGRAKAADICGLSVPDLTAVLQDKASALTAKQLDALEANAVSVKGLRV
jgi:hypothetical protein